MFYPGDPDRCDRLGSFVHVSIRSLKSLESLTAIQTIVTITWKPGLRNSEYSKSDNFWKLVLAAQILIFLSKIRVRHEFQSQYQ